MRARLGATSLNASLRAIPTAESLIAMSSFAHRKTAARVRNKRKITAFRYRPQSLTSLVRRKKHFAAAIVEAGARQECTIAKRLVSTVDQAPAITPL